MQTTNFPFSATRASHLFLQLALGAICTLVVAACQTDGLGPIAAIAPAQKTEVGAERAEPPKTQVARPAEPEEESEPMTRARAARECWMKTEKAGVRENLDKRADLVNKCIDDKLKAATSTAPKT
ncbi:MAG TPA: hypothetical protein VFP60_02470 [Pseudolabrys sp.]|nr:hypothetical protein [Pseudolabrys sp.]